MEEYVHKLKRNVDEELQKISEKGLNSSNIENAFKLTLMKEKLCRTEQLEEEMQGGQYSHRGYSRDNDYSGDGRYTMNGEYSNRGNYSRDHSMDGDYSGAQHYVRGHYSRGGPSMDGYSGDYSGGDYSGAGGRMENCKREMMDALATMERTADPKDKQRIMEYKRMIGSMEI